MSEARNPELEALILERPDDVTRWLVYGDWLVEQKSPRGELMNVQHQLAMVTDARVRSRLKSESLNLISQEESRLLGPDASLTTGEHPALALEWRFGFLHTLTLTLDDDALGARLVRLIAQSPASQFVRHLTLHARRTLEETWAAVTTAPWPVLDSLTLGHNLEVARLLVSVAHSERPRLRRLALTRVGRADLACAVLAPLLPRLSELSITLSDLTHEGVRTLAATGARLDLVEVGGNELPMSAKPALRTLAREVRFGRQRIAEFGSTESGLVLFDRLAPKDVIDRTVVQVSKHRGVRDVFVRETTHTIDGKPRTALQVVGADVPLDVLAESLARRAEFLPRAEKFRALALSISERDDEVQVRAFHEAGELFGLSCAAEGPATGRALSEFLGCTVPTEMIYGLCERFTEVDARPLLLKGQSPDAQGALQTTAPTSLVSRHLDLPPTRVREPHEEQANEHEAQRCDHCGQEAETWLCDSCEDMEVCEGCGRVERSNESFNCPNCVAEGRDRLVGERYETTGE